MKKYVYSTYDTVASCYGDPFVRIEAPEQLAEAQARLCKHRKYQSYDFIVYKLGIFDDLTGRFVLDENVSQVFDARPYSKLGDPVDVA